MTVAERNLLDDGVGGADDETRTRDIDLGKVALYQLSYIRRRSGDRPQE